MTNPTASGIVSLISCHSVDETVARLQSAIRARSIREFVLIDHSGEAEKAGLSMRPTRLLIFGNPKAGTPLMLAAPSVALDLPLRILVSEDAAGKVWISYNSLSWLQSRHSLPPEMLQNLAVLELLASEAAG